VKIQNRKQNIVGNKPYRSFTFFALIPLRYFAVENHTAKETKCALVMQRHSTLSGK